MSAWDIPLSSSKDLIWACDNFFLHLEDPSFQGMDYFLLVERPNIRHAFIFYDMEDPNFQGMVQLLLLYYRPTVGMSSPPPSLKGTALDMAHSLSN